MSVKLIHTADWQLGKPFAGIADETKRVLVQQERLQCLRRIADAVQAHRASFVLVAGDMFDTASPAKETVVAACGAIGAMGVPVLVIPGNHDHGGPGGVWEQSFFLEQRHERAPNLRVLLAAEPVELDDAVVFPCPLLRRHEADDTSAWVRDVLAANDSYGSKPRIVLAHGSVQGFTAVEDDEDGVAAATNRIELDRLPRSAIDYFALGDWHGTKQVGATAWYAGTPEIDRFPKSGENRPGHVLAVTVARGVPPVVEEVRTAGLGWHTLGFAFAGDDSLAVLEHEVRGVLGGRVQRDLLQLELVGALGIEAGTRLRRMLDGWEASLLRLKLVDRTVIAPTKEEIEALTMRADDPLIASVAARLVVEAGGDGEAAVVARLALRELHAACLG